MKKKNLIIVLTIIFMLVLIPIPLKLKDGGSTEYKALLYSITRIHRINYQSLTGYEDGWKIELLGIQIYNKTVYIEELKTDNYELIFDLKTCLNCYKKIYEFEDGTKIYSSCNVKYKSQNVEISLSDALNSNILTLADLEREQGLIIVKPSDDKPLGCLE